MNSHQAAEATRAVTRDWARGYESQHHEYTLELSAAEGRIPPELHGTLYRNGPGLLDVAGVPVHHPFDGDGMVAAVHFEAGRAHYRNRMVRTAAYLAEQRAGRPLFRGVFGTQLPGGLLTNAFNLRLKNIANTGVLAWGERLLALWEAAEPHRLDPTTLETLGLDRLDGLLGEGEPFAAHYHIDPACALDGGQPALVNFGMRVGLNTTLTLFEFGPDFDLRRHHAYQLDGFAFLHDMAITPNYVLFIQNPIRYDPLPYAFGLQSAAQGLRSLPDAPSTIIVIPRQPGVGRVRSFRAPNGFVWHHVNAYEDRDDLVIDSIWYDSYVGISPETDFRTIDVTTLPPGRLARTRINLRTGSLERRFLGERCCEFPTLHPAAVGRPYRYAYLCAGDAPSGNAHLQAIWKVDLTTGAEQLWSAGPRGFVGEPIFVPRPDGPTSEDSGWLLVMVYDAARHESDLVILDAQQLHAGPVARLPLGHHLPHGLHGTFRQAVSR